MKLTDKYFGQFFGMSLLCGLLVFLLAATIWYGMAQVSWFDCYWIAAVIILCWGIGGIAGWLITPKEKVSQLWLRIYVMSVVTYFVGSILFGVWDPSVSGWTIMFIIGFALFSFPFALLLGLINHKLIQKILQHEKQ